MKAKKAYEVLTSACVCNDILEALFIKISGGPIVGVVYCPSSSSVQSFLEYLEAGLEGLSHGHRNYIAIVGDINSDTSLTLIINFYCNPITCEQRQHMSQVLLVH